MDPVNVPAKFVVRSFTRSWDNRGYSKNLGSHWIRPRSFLSQIYKGLLFGWTLWIYLPNLKFVAIRVPEIIGGMQKIGPSLDTPTLPFLHSFSWACVRMDPLKSECISNLKFVALPVHEKIRGTQTKFGSPWIGPRSLFSKIFKGLLFGCTLWIYLPNLKFVALSVPEIIGGTPKIGAVLDASTFPFLPNF